MAGFTVIPSLQSYARGWGDSLLTAKTQNYGNDETIWILVSVIGSNRSNKMAQRCVRFPAKLVVVVLLPLILPGTFSAQRDREIELFVESLNSQGVAATTGDPRLLRTRFVDVNLDLLASQVERVPGRSVEVQNIRLNLFDDTSFTAVPDRIEATGTDSFTWTGHLQGVEPSEVSLVVRDGVLAGNITMPGTSYEVRYEESGVYSINQIDPAAFPPEAPPIPVHTPSTFPAIAGDDGSTIDVMVVYTTTARLAAGGTGAMNALIALAVSESNTGYANSNVTQRLRLVHTAEVEYSEAGFNWTTTLNRLTNTADGFMDEVHALRDTYGADAVVLIVNDTAFCGQAWLMTTVSDGFKTFAFSLVSRICAAGNYSFAHELGHNMGSHHDRANASGPGGFSLFLWVPGAEQRLSDHHGVQLRRDGLPARQLLVQSGGAVQRPAHGGRSDPP